MECLLLCSSTPSILPFRKALTFPNGHHFPSNFRNPELFSSSLSSLNYTNCRERIGVDAPLSSTSAYVVLGVEPDCSAAELKAAFRAKVHTFTLFESAYALFFLFLVAIKMEENKTNLTFALWFFFPSPGVDLAANKELFFEGLMKNSAKPFR